jgi:hypothetical protein
VNSDPPIKAGIIDYDKLVCARRHLGTEPISNRGFAAESRVEILPGKLGANGPCGINTTPRIALVNSNLARVLQQSWKCEYSRAKSKSDSGNPACVHSSNHEDGTDLR